MKDNNGLISVIVPVYNVEEYLSDCVKSVLAQTYKNFELILVDDGSKDSSRDICEKYAKQDDRVKVFYKKNGGASSARNYGVKLAKGHYIYFLDSDDWLGKNALQLLVEKSSCEDAEIVFFDAYSVEQDTQKISTNQYYHKNNYNSGNGFELMGEMMKNKEFRVSPCLVFFKADFIKENNLRFEEGIMYEDMIFAYQAFTLAKKIAYLQKYLYYRRYRENSVMTSRKSKKNFVSAKRVYYKVKEFSQQNKILEDEIAQKYVTRCAFNVLNLYKKMSKEEKKVLKSDYRELKNDILNQNAYADKALQMRCYGEIFWFMYKIFEKVILR